MEKIGVVHGRFQVLHNDHMKYILAAKEKCEHLIIGICNPEDALTKYSSANPHRSKHSSNPLTYYERAECIKLAMQEEHISLSDFTIVPFPINYPERLFNYVPLEACFYMTIYDDWGREKYHTLHDELGLHVDVLWDVLTCEKGISASDVRQCIHEGSEWSQYVPSSVYNYIVSRKLDYRIKSLLNENEIA